MNHSQPFLLGTNWFLCKRCSIWIINTSVYCIRILFFHCFPCFKFHISCSLTFITSISYLWTLNFSYDKFPFILCSVFKSSLFCKIGLRQMNYQIEKMSLKFQIFTHNNNWFVLRTMNIFTSDSQQSIFLFY